ncbi:MAG: DUF934 domain-containing protein [Rhodobacteraceae bacterium]|jgi:hypothetical protein|nr:DUF934 domain-containing protein [Paracoccaceae bacterium]
MEHYPVYLSLRDKRVLVVGTGECALAKLRLLMKTPARILRLMGFSGHLRAYGHVISDQYAMARRSGFDDVEVSKALATRQPEAEWLFRSNWSAHDYQTRLRKSAWQIPTKPRKSKVTTKHDRV